MNVTQDSSILENKFLQSVYEGAKDVGEVIITTALIVPCCLVIVVALPIIGAIGTPLCLSAAGYHYFSMVYHEKHTSKKDKDGNFIPGTEFSQMKENDPKHYNNKMARFNTHEDFLRIQHEVDRLYHFHAMIQSLKWARCLSKALIPLFGIQWIVETEDGKNGCQPYPTKKVVAVENKKLMIQENLEFHLTPLGRKFNNLDALNETLHKPNDTVFENVPSDTHAIIKNYLEAAYTQPPNSPNPGPANLETS